MTQIKENLKGQATNPKSRSSKEATTIAKFGTFYDEDGIPNICYDCTNKMMKIILEEYNVTKLKLKNKADFEKLMDITYCFIAMAENRENQESD
jgi:hypothetical protein